jgi:hypothetical protein
MNGSRESSRVARVVALVALFTAAAPVRAEVTRMTITARTPFAGGATFGTVGAYEKIKGVLTYEVDPGSWANGMVFDLEYAPTNARGKVEFTGEFIMLKPVDLSKGNHRLLFEVNNRGNLRALGYYNDARDSNDPATAEHAGNGFLMRQGFTVLWAAWNWDAVPGDGRMQIALPVATDHGQPIFGGVNAETVTAFLPPKDVRDCQPVAWGNSHGYEPVLPGDPGAPADLAAPTLTVRDDPWGPKTEIPATQWYFTSTEISPSSRFSEALSPRRITNFCVTSDGTYPGIKTGRIYEIIYTAKDPRVVGLGLTAIRDAISFFRFDAADGAGNVNPLAEGGAVDPQYAYLFGISQSGRVITHFLWQGFHVDERNRMVVEGMIPHVAGGGKGGFNWRFAQPTHHPSHLEGLYYPTDFFPFTYSAETDAATGATGSLLDRATSLGKVPKVIVTNHESEYFMRAASLVHTDPTGTSDVEFPANVRYYMVNGAQHGAPGSRTRALYEYSGTTVDQRPVGRAVLLALDGWVSRGVEPPASRYPRIGAGQLVTVGEHKARYPAIPGVRVRGTCEQAPRLDYGPRFFSEGIQDVVPPRHLVELGNGGDFVNLVPQPDADGNTVGGVLLPDVAVPLGTYAGWNPRRADIGNPEYLARWDGSFFMFAPTEADRAATGDPRPSIEARYKNRGQYVSKVTQAAHDLVKDGLLLAEDADAITARAANMVWPPQPIEAPPFWSQKP